MLSKNNQTNTYVRWNTGKMEFHLTAFIFSPDSYTQKVP